jgi:hypothetical protein
MGAARPGLLEEAVIEDHRNEDAAESPYVELETTLGRCL